MAEDLALADLDNLREVETIYKNAGRMLDPFNLPVAVFLPPYPPATHGFVSWDERVDPEGNAADLQNIKDRTGDHTWYSKYEENREWGLISVDEPATVLLYGRLSAARNDIGPFDDPYYVNFWIAVNEINGHVDDATDIYKGLAQDYYDFQQEYKQIFQTLRTELEATGISNYENVLSWVLSTFETSAFTATEEAGELRTTAWSEDMPFWAPTAEGGYGLTRGYGDYQRIDAATQDIAVSKEALKSHLETLQKV